MDQEGARQPLTGEARLAAYLDTIVGGLGHASRAASAQAYCTALLLPGERKSIEPMAARLDPAHVQARHQSLHHVVAQAEWDDAAVLGAVRAQVLRRSSGMGRWLTGLSTTAAFPSRANTRWGWRGSIAGSWASRTPVRWRSASRWPMTTPACRSPSGCSCPRRGRTIRPAGPRPAFQRRSASRPRP